MNKRIENAFKKIKNLWDAYKIILGVLALLGGLGTSGYVLYDADAPVQAPVEPVEREKVQQLKIIHVNPDYALKDHTHPPTGDIERAFKDHDPQQLGH